MDKKQEQVTVVYNTDQKSRIHRNGEQVIDFKDALVSLGILDPYTAKHVQNGLIKLLNHIAVTGNRVGIKQGTKHIMQLVVLESSKGPRLKAVFGKELQRKVKANILSTPSRPEETQ